MARFVNPYNFVPIGKGSADKENRIGRDEIYCSRSGLKSGWIDVSMMVKNPLIVPDGAHPEYYDTRTGKKIERPTDDQKKEAHKKYSFYHVEENGKTKYIIPGSELRGMIRSVYEAITDSCFPFLLNDKPVGQRVPTFSSFQRKGLLQYDATEKQWSLWKAWAEREHCIVKGDRIFYENTEYRCGEYREEYGYVQCNIPVSNKDKYQLAFLNIDGEEPLYTWGKGDEEPYRMLRYALDREDVKGNQNNPNKKQAESLKKYLEQIRRNGGKVPVWFTIVMRDGKKIVYLSNSSIGRVAQRRKWKDIFAYHKPCDDTGNLCPACTLFGTIKGNGLKGRVRFSDAECPDGVPERKFYLLDILGEPRTSAFEFYLKKPTEDATYWNFDFYGHTILDEKGKEKNEYLDLAEATPRGRKMYWHGNPAEGNSRTKWNATMEGVDAKTRFEFKIYFDQITEQQLQDLIWVISLGENENTEQSHMLHKLGHARPLGYGSVKLWVNQYHVREISCKNGELSVDVKDYPVGEKPICNFDVESDIYKSLMAMCNSNSVSGKEVRYPQYIKKNGRGQKDDSIYQWFSNNRKNTKDLKTLPEPMDKNIMLYGSWLPHNDESENQDTSQAQQQYTSVGIQKGTIKKLNKEKGWGFISYEKGDIFFHCNDLLRGLTMEDFNVGDRVSFEIGTGGKGPAAKKVKKEK